MQPRLITITGPMKGTVIQLSDEQLSIGRDPSNQVTINDPLLSRKHCAIRNSGGEIRVADLESLNGTFVNGFPTHEKKLEHGDRIKVGVSQFIFLLEDDVNVTDVPLTDAGEEQFITAVTVRSSRSFRSSVAPFFSSATIRTNSCPEPIAIENPMRVSLSRSAEPLPARSCATALRSWVMTYKPASRSGRAKASSPRRFDPCCAFL